MNILTTFASKIRNMKFETKAILAGQEADKATGATVVPIYQTSTFTQEELNKNKGYEYSRIGNPTRNAFEVCLASLEEGKYGLSFSSGLAAEHAILFSLLRPGDHIIAPEDMYGGTYRLIKEIVEPYNISCSLIDFTNLELIKQTFKPSTKMIWIETPTNPTLKIFDIAAISEISRRRNAISVVDNTFMSPHFQKPLTLGTDIVVHSSTKYINGHSDVIGGAVVLNDDELYKKIRFVQKTVGAVPSPFDAWLTLRGLKTLAIRMERHEKNAMIIARFLETHPNVEKVFYPGLETHQGYELAKKQMTGFGGIVSFMIKGGKNEANEFFKKLKIFQLADSLGGVESLVNYSAIMSHSSFPTDLRNKIGVTDNFIRISVGIENHEDLIEDIKNALDGI